MNLSKIIETLGLIADIDIASMIMDEQEKAERYCRDNSLRPDSIGDDGQYIVYPENACPELDNARTLILEAIEQLVQYAEPYEVPVGVESSKESLQSKRY